MIKAVGVGDYVMDRYYHYGMMFPGGNALNFAVYSKQLGHEAAFVSVLADDSFVAHALDALDAYQVDRSRCVQRHGATWLCDTKLENGDRTITDSNDCGVIKNQPLDVDDALLDYLKGFDIIHANVNGWLGEGLKRLKSTGVPVIYDYSDLWKSEQDLYEIAPYIDFAFFSGKKLPRPQIDEFLKELIGLGCRMAICTIGKQGAIAYDGSRYYVEQPYLAQGEVVDTLGAGDSFLTAFITTYIEGRKRFYAIVQSEPTKFISEGSKRAFQESLIAYSMQIGNLFAARTCMIMGAFGRGVPLREA